MQVRYSLVMVAAILVLVGVSCSSTDEEAAHAISSTTAPTTPTSGATTPSTTVNGITASTTSTTIVVRTVDRQALVGGWGAQFANQRFFFVFSDRGSFEALYFLEAEHPFDFGTYEFDGRTLTLRSSPRATGSPCGGLSATYIVSFSEDEQRFTLPEAAADDECQRREGEMTRVEFTKQQ